MKKKFKYKIGFKLIAIISLIIITALSSMTYITSSLSRREMERNIDDQNLQTVNLIALNTQFYFTTIINKSEIIASTILDNNLEKYALYSDLARILNQNKQIMADLVFTRDKDFIFIGIARKTSAGSIEILNSLMNQQYLNENNLNDVKIDSVINGISGSIINGFAGLNEVINISPYFTRPAICITSPYRMSDPQINDTILVIIISPEKLIKSIESQNKLVSSFIVNRQGEILIHENPEFILKKTEFKNLKIVDTFLKSRTSPMKQEYEYFDRTLHIGSFQKVSFGDCGIITSIPKNEAFKPVLRNQKISIYITLIVLSIAILTVYFFSKSISRPIKTLVEATRNILQGIYNIKLKATTRDEIGELTAAFQNMSNGLAEREKIKDAFGKFVNKDIAEKVMKNELTLGGERKNVAILFSDLRSFTSISESLQPEEVVEFLNEYLSLMVHCINTTKGVVDKFIGDAIMAVWGTPISYGNDTENAINAALIMRKKLYEYNLQRKKQKKFTIHFGIGINTGNVIAGQIGSETRMEYTVIGDAVNFASRIEALNKPFGTDILISHDSYMLVKDKYDVVPMEQITVKGKKDTQQIYAVLGRLNVMNRPKNLEQLRKITGIKPQDQRKRNIDLKENKYEIISN